MELLRKLHRQLVMPLTYLRSDYRADLYQEMHRNQRFAGMTWKSSIELFEQAVPNVRQLTILDYGCGPRGGAAQEYGERVISYDPYVTEFAQPPWDHSFDVVFSSDVLEHMTLGEVSEFCGHVRNSSARYAFLVVSTRSANKRLPNGVNAHLTVKAPHWWMTHLHKLLACDFDITLAKADLIAATVTLCFCRENFQTAKRAA